MNFIPAPKTKFFRLKCNSCGNEQNVFSSASSLISCLVCNTTLAFPSSGRIKTKAKILKELE